MARVSVGVYLLSLCVDFRGGGSRNLPVGPRGDSRGNGAQLTAGFPRAMDSRTGRGAQRMTGSLNMIGALGGGKGEESKGIVSSNRQASSESKAKESRRSSMAKRLSMDGMRAYNFGLLAYILKDEIVCEVPLVDGQ